MFKISFLILCLFGSLSLAGESSQLSILKIEKTLSMLSGCSSNQPCNIEIFENENGFMAKVVKAAMITEDGVLKYLPSATYYQLNKIGEIVSTNPTP